MSETRRRELQSDLVTVSGLLAWEWLFGPKLLSWTELAELGASLTVEEAERYLKGESVGKDRAQLYRLLFAHHRELKTFLGLRGEKSYQAARDGALAPVENFPWSAPTRSSGQHHFVARLSPEVEPEPTAEITAFLQRAKASPDLQAWFPTKAPAGRGWEPAPKPPSIGLIFHRLRSRQGFDGFVAAVQERRDYKPKGDRALDALYGGGTQFRNWWLFADPARIRFDSLDQLPGSSAAGKRAAHSFRGRLSFGFWDFGVSLPVLRAFLSV
jgi:hypothetical protein